MKKYETPNVNIIYEGSNIVTTSLKDADTNLNVPEDSGNVDNLFGQN